MEKIFYRERFINILILLTIIWFPAAASEQKKKNATVFKHPIREQSVIVTKEGYYPKSINLVKGEKLRLFLTTTNGQGCLVIPSHNIFMAGREGSVTTKEILFEKEGKYSFHCPTNKIKGKIIVRKNPFEKVKPGASRRIASTIDSDSEEQWRPLPQMDW
ncbi:MAG: cupredoxin domain-containing protein [Halobacteriovoraceae bacterium]|nr:cupredoxin domain-containing protein [Halobacteriovoraceae bacterium]